MQEEHKNDEITETEKDVISNEESQKNDDLVNPDDEKDNKDSKDNQNNQDDKNDQDDKKTLNQKSKGSVNKKTKNNQHQNQVKKDSVMTPLVSGIRGLPNLADLIEGPVISMGKGKVFVDLKPFGTGLIYGREYIIARDIIKKINLGDKITAKVVDPENEDGYIELSLKEARQAMVWDEAEEAMKEKRVLIIAPKEANKGGLIVEWQGIVGFLPASQLNSEHYPRVPDGDKDKIFDELKKLVSEKLELNIIGVVPKEGKLIFSEKSLNDKEKAKMLGNYTLGDEVEGEVTGIVDFGVFLKLEEGLEGLVHISELDWGLVDNPRAMFKVGDKVKAKVIEIKDGKISLSVKTLKENPWVSAEKKYKKGDIVKAVVIKFNRHGALASIEEGVAGLVHISEFGSEDKLREEFGLGKTYEFKITLFEPKEQKMTLSYFYKEEEAKAKAKKEDADDVEVKIKSDDISEKETTEV